MVHGQDGKIRIGVLGHPHQALVGGLLPGGTIVDAAGRGGQALLVRNQTITALFQFGQLLRGAWVLVPGGHRRLIFGHQLAMGLGLGLVCGAVLLQLLAGHLVLRQRLVKGLRLSKGWCHRTDRDGVSGFLQPFADQRSPRPILRDLLLHLAFAQALLLQPGVSGDHGAADQLIPPPWRRVGRQH